MSVTLRIISLAAGGESPFDGQYVRRYDPSYHPNVQKPCEHCHGTGQYPDDPEGAPTRNCPYCDGRGKGEAYDGGLLLVTSNKEEARQFEDAAEALEYWRQSYGVRADGLPNKPLTAFTVEVS